MIQLRRAPDDAGAWFLTCGNLRLDQGGTLGDLLSSLAVYPPRIARLLFQGCYLAPAGLDLRACGRDVLPGVTRLLFVQQPNAVGLDRLLRLLPSLEVLNVDDAGIVHSYGFLHALQANPAWPGWNNLPWPAGLNTLQLTNCGLKALPLGLHLAGACKASPALLCLLRFASSSPGIDPSSAFLLCSSPGQACAPWCWITTISLCCRRP